MFRDDHVQIVGFDLVLQQTAIVSSVVLRRHLLRPLEALLLLLISGYFHGAQCNCNARAGGCCKHVAALLYNILGYVELGLAIILENKTCTDE